MSAPESKATNLTSQNDRDSYGSRSPPLEKSPSGGHPAIRCFEFRDPATLLVATRTPLLN